jgi:hypothetical protein
MECGLSSTPQCGAAITQPTWGFLSYYTLYLTVNYKGQTPIQVQFIQNTIGGLANSWTNLALSSKITRRN